jgi:uncharacterized peroxidase-related enzyme
MTFIATTHPRDADAALADMYARQQTAWGFVPNYAKVFCHRPELMSRWGLLLAEIKRPMDKRRFELVTFAAAHELGNTYCTLAHGKALREFFTDEQITALMDGRAAGVLSLAEHAMFAFAQRVAHDAATVTAGHVAALGALGFDDAEIFDIVAAVAARAFFTNVLDALGTQADAPFAAVRQAFGGSPSRGRAIDASPVVGMTTTKPTAAR